jgi:hypothetical protein
MIIMISLVVLFLVIFGVFLVFTPSDRLCEYARRCLFGITIPMPEEGTTARKLLIVFYRFLGITALLMSAFMIVMLIVEAIKWIT